VIDAEELEQVFSVMRGMLNRPTVAGLRSLAGLAGFNVTRFPGVDRRPPIFAEMNQQFRLWSVERKSTALSILANSLARSEASKAELQELLRPHGFDYVAGSFVHVALVDERDAPFLPVEAQADLSKALSRLAGGDYSGAVSAACGAVDSVTQSLYEARGLGPPPPSFQTKVNTLLKPLWDEMLREYQEDGLSEPDARELVKHLRETVNGAAQVMQILRRTKGDVHGTKKARVQTVYYAIKSASAICGLLEAV